MNENSPCLNLFSSLKTDPGQNVQHLHLEPQHPYFSRIKYRAHAFDTHTHTRDVPTSKQQEAGGPPAATAALHAARVDRHLSAAHW